MVLLWVVLCCFVCSFLFFLGLRVSLWGCLCPCISCCGVLGPSNPSIRSMPTWAWSKASGTMRSPCAMLLGKDGYAFWNLVWGSCGRGTKVLLYLLTGSLPWDEEDESLWPHLRELAPSFSSED